ncbi:ATP-binding protein [Paracoccus sp. PAMC 22219]|uniref:ATP-binding protein n=1 Tax=Paracoccus sp. PAMC 22219 TaxID=1569209 RepID=UPI000AFCE742|nr:ATP-binding protein [Paracoccus sp. PAMC 22219]
MPTMTENLPNRVRKLTKPRNYAQAMQPFLEAVSNSIMAIDDRCQELEGLSNGVVKVVISDIGADDICIEISDNGIGLDKYRYDAFCEIDTDFKKERGGKGVGRLYWLDAFNKIEVISQFKTDTGISRRSFEFRLAQQDQVVENGNLQHDLMPDATGTIVRFKGLRQGPYLDLFPKRAATINDYLAAEFISNFLSKVGPVVTLSATTKGGTLQTATYPKDVSELVARGPEAVSDICVQDGSSLAVTCFLCDKKASSGLAGRHQVHLLGNSRTVESRNVDDLIAIGPLRAGHLDDLALHILVSGELLDNSVAESRTSFTLPEAEVSEIVKGAVKAARSEFISDQLSEFDKARRAEFDKFLRHQPIFGFANSDEIFASLPANAKSPEDFVSRLALPRFRAEQKREEALSSLVEKIVAGDQVPENFGEVVRRAAEGVQDNERAALGHHAARRRVVLDLMDRLIRRLRTSPDKDKNHVENTLHTLLAPMKINSSNPEDEERAAHDLWLLDERLAFASGFSSDKRLAAVLAENDSDLRPDIFLWDVLYALGPVGNQGGAEDVEDTEPLSTVFIVELKHPGRENYKPDERIEDQVRRYVTEIKGGKIEGFGRRRIRVSDDCQFHCLVVADFHGKLAEEVSGWYYVHNRRGRERRLGGDHSSVIIQAVEWDYVLSTSRQANRALLDAAGLVRPRTTNFTQSTFENNTEEGQRAAE